MPGASAACSSSTTERPRSLVGRVFAHDEVSHGEDNRGWPSVADHLFQRSAATGCGCHHAPVLPVRAPRGIDRRYRRPPPVDPAHRGVDGLRRRRVGRGDVRRHRDAVAAARIDLRALGGRRRRDAHLASGPVGSRGEGGSARGLGAHGIEFNMARAIRPALAGGLIAVAGVGAAFLANVASFFGVIVVVARWKRPIRTRTTPAKTLEGATIAAIRYIRNVPVTRAVNAARRRCDVLRERSACPPANRCARNQPKCDRLVHLIPDAIEQGSDRATVRHWA